MSDNMKPVGKLVPFEQIREPWSEYQLADGNALRVRLNLIAVRKTNKVGKDGKPIYNIQTNLSMGVFTEEEGYVRLKR